MALQPSRRSGRNAPKNAELEQIAEISHLASETFMAFEAIDQWATSAASGPLKTFKKHCIDDTQCRAFILRFLGDDRDGWIHKEDEIANISILPFIKSVVPDLSKLEPIVRLGRVAYLLFKYCPSFAGLANEKADPLLNYRCTARLLLAIIADFQDNHHGYFIKLLGEPKPSMYAPKPGRRHAGSRHLNKTDASALNAFSTPGTMRGGRRAKPKPTTADDPEDLTVLDDIAPV